MKKNCNFAPVNRLTNNDYLADYQAIYVLTTEK